jgi:HAD superfamily hydrolase (TIGR01509 family)
MQALIFDFDGLILDTELPEYLSWSEIYKRYDCDLPLSVWAACIGTHGGFNPFDYLEEQAGQSVNREEMYLWQRRLCGEFLAEKTVLPGVERYIIQAKMLGLKLAVASASPREWVVGHLERLGLLSYFDAIRTRDDVTKVKPDPELYLAALAALDVSADQAFALEDSPNGVHAAKNANLFCVAIPNTLTSQLSLEHADMKLTSMEEISLQELIARVEASRVKL